MDKDLKNDLKNLAKEMEVKLAESILRWKHNKEGKKMPGKKGLEHKSRLIADQANKMLAGSGKTIWNEIKNVYRKDKKYKGKGD